MPICRLELPLGRTGCMLAVRLVLIEVGAMPRRSTSKTRGRSQDSAGSKHVSEAQQFRASECSQIAPSRGEILLAGQSHVLELLAKGAGLETVLAELALTIERCSPGMLCSVLVYDSNAKCLRHGAAPSLPASYNAAVDGVAIGPAAGSCGTAAYNRKRIIVEDISSDLLWVDFRAIALENNLRACWSQPVLSAAGDVLGTFAMYYETPRGPTAEEIELIERAAYLAGIAIERTVSDKIVRDNEERFRQLTETVRLIPWEANPKTFQFTYVGPQAVEILGYPIDAWYEDRFWLNHLHPDDREWAEDFCRKHSKTDNHHDFEYRMMAADGRTVWLHDIVRVTRREGRRVLRGFMIDVSDRKRAEESLRQADRLASLGTFAAGIAHEINNPLGAILLASEGALAINEKQVGDEKLEVLLRLIHHDTERCGRIVGGVLKFSRHGSNDHNPHLINDVILSAVELTRSYAQDKRAIVNVDLSPSISPVRVNMLEMEQVLVNLIRNAIEAESSGVTVTIRTWEKGRSIHFSVHDDGAGITAEEASHLFDPFYTTRQRDGGTGLGLSIVHGIVAMHGGRIDVESHVDQGTTVHVRLPK